MRTLSDLSEALRDHMRQLKMTGARLSAKSGVSTGAISALLNSQRLCRVGNFEAIVRTGIEEPWSPWHAAWTRANQDRRHNARTRENLAEEIADLRQRVAQLEEELRKSRKSGEVAAGGSAAGHSRMAYSEEQSRRNRERGLAMLNQAGRPLIETARPSDHKDVLFDISSVKSCLEKVRQLALTDLVELDAFLHTTSPYFPVVSKKVDGDSPGCRGNQVYYYFQKLRKSLDVALGDPPDN
ncbi:hypothetical protein [Streptomyces nigrescens]|uniref:hypothetical protein n=1 Tax=Streptomyces nigrescens TaxID=1920 RepID=UPI003495104C